MQYSNIHNVICFAGLKHAALYFDRVLPVSFRKLTASEKGWEYHIPEPIPEPAFSHVVFGEDRPTGINSCRNLAVFLEEWDRFSKAIGPSRPRPPISSTVDDYSDVKEMYLQNVVLDDGRSVRHLFHEFANDLGIEYASVLLDKATTSEGFEYASLTLLNLPMIDAESAEWEQILELRKNSEARSKLRRLRLFLQTNYEGKPISYVEDDLLSRIEEYDSARRSLGFNAMTSSLGQLLNFKSIHAAAAAGLAATLFGGPAVGISTAAVIEFGEFTLELARHRHSIREFEKGHQLAYLIDVKSKMAGPK